MKLCESCRYRNNTEYEKPCIVYRDNCEFYEKERRDMTDDLISRDAVIYYIKGHIHEIITESGEDKNAHTNRVLRALINGVETMPPVNPQEPKTGHWEWVQYDENPKLGDWHCSECRCVVVECVYKNEKGGIPLYKYCPQCGRRMVEPQERSE